MPTLCSEPTKCIFENLWKMEASDELADKVCTIVDIHIFILEFVMKLDEPRGVSIEGFICIFRHVCKLSL